MSDELDTETPTWQHNTQNRQTSMCPVGFEPIILAGEQSQSYALDHAATGTSMELLPGPNFTITY
jgi:hypothetical protein